MMEECFCARDSRADCHCICREICSDSDKLSPLFYHHRVWTSHSAAVSASGDWPPLS